MLASLMKEHQIRQQERKAVQELRRKLAVEAVGKLTNALADNLNSSVAIAYSNQKKIDGEAKQLQSNAAQFARQTAQWLKLMEDFNTALKEIGDVENWSKSIEADMKTVSSSLEYVYKVDVMMVFSTTQLINFLKICDVHVDYRISDGTVFLYVSYPQLQKLRRE